MIGQWIGLAVVAGIYLWFFRTLRIVIRRNASYRRRKVLEEQMRNAPSLETMRKLYEAYAGEVARYGNYDGTYPKLDRYTDGD